MCSLNEKSKSSAFPIAVSFFEAAPLMLPGGIASNK